MAKLIDTSGTVVFEGEIEDLPASGIPQGGPLTQDLAAGAHKITGLADGTAATDAAAFGQVIPQGGPLSADLLAGNHSIHGATVAGGTGARAQPFDGPGGGVGGDYISAGGSGVAGQAGGDAYLAGGAGNAGATNPAQIKAGAGTAAAHGRARVDTNNSPGAAGQALVSDGADALVYGGVLVAAGVPGGPPNARLPFAVDTTAVTGGLYVWTGAAWVKVSALP